MFKLTSDRFSAEHAADHFLRSYASPSRNDHCHVKHYDTNDDCPRVNTSHFASYFEPDLHGQDFSRLLEEKAALAEQVVSSRYYAGECRESDPGQLRQEVNLSRSMELALPATDNDTALEDHYADVLDDSSSYSTPQGGYESSDEQIRSAAQAGTPRESADTAHTSHASQHVAQIGHAEVSLFPTQQVAVTEAVGAQQAATEMVVEDGRDDRDDLQALLSAYYETKARPVRRRTLSEAFQKLFPVHAVANLIPVPKHWRQLIATLAFDLQIKISDAGRKGGAGADRNKFTKLHDALHKAKWRRYEDEAYFYYYRTV